MKALVPVEDDEAKELIGWVVLTGLRKATDSPGAMEIWQAIDDDAADDAWNEALGSAVNGLRLMGIRLCREVDGDIGD